MHAQKPIDHKARRRLPVPAGNRHGDATHCNNKTHRKKGTEKSTLWPRIRFAMANSVTGVYQYELKRCSTINALKEIRGEIREFEVF
jgi:hypothetical protein